MLDREHGYTGVYLVFCTHLYSLWLRGLLIILLCLVAIWENLNLVSIFILIHLILNKLAWIFVSACHGKTTCWHTGLCNFAAVCTFTATWAIFLLKDGSWWAFCHVTPPWGRWAAVIQLQIQLLQKASCCSSDHVGRVFLFVEDDSLAKGAQIAAQYYFFSFTENCFVTKKQHSLIFCL